jgi:hypothetical protein
MRPFLGLGWDHDPGMAFTVSNWFKNLLEKLFGMWDHGLKLVFGLLLDHGRLVDHWTTFGPENPAFWSFIFFSSQCLRSVSRFWNWFPEISSPGNSSPGNFSPNISSRGISSPDNFSPGQFFTGQILAQIFFSSKADNSSPDNSSHGQFRLDNYPPGQFGQPGEELSA